MPLCDFDISDDEIKGGIGERTRETISVPSSVPGQDQIPCRVRPAVLRPTHTQIVMTSLGPIAVTAELIPKQ